MNFKNIMRSTACNKVFVFKQLPLIFRVNLHQLHLEFRIVHSCFKLKNLNEIIKIMVNKVYSFETNSEQRVISPEDEAPQHEDQVKLVLNIHVLIN
jgi:hypothetical protein